MATWVSVTLLDWSRPCSASLPQYVLDILPDWSRPPHTTRPQLNLSCMKPQQRLASVAPRTTLASLTVLVCAERVALATLAYAALSLLATLVGQLISCIFMYAPYSVEHT